MKFGTVPNSMEEEQAQNKILRDFEHMPGYHEFPRNNQEGVNKVNLSKEIRRSTNQNAFYGRESYFSKEGDVGLKGEGGYRIILPIVDWAGNEIATEIFRGAGGYWQKQEVGPR